MLAAFREIVTEGAGTPSLTARRARLRVAAVAGGTTLALLGGGVAAAATGSLPHAAQTVAKDVLGTVGVHVPGPDRHAGDHPDQRGHSGKTKTHTPGPAGVTPAGTSPSAPGAVQPPHPAHPSHPTHPAHPVHPVTPGASAHPTTVPTPGNSGTARHHGNPTPASTVHPAPHHGKPAAAPVVSRRGNPQRRPEFTRSHL